MIAFLSIINWLANVWKFWMQSLVLSQSVNIFFLQVCLVCTLCSAFWVCLTLFFLNGKENWWEKVVQYVKSFILIYSGRKLGLLWYSVCCNSSQWPGRHTSYTDVPFIFKFARSLSMNTRDIVHLFNCCFAWANKMVDKIFKWLQTVRRKSNGTHYSYHKKKCKTSCLVMDMFVLSWVWHTLKFLSLSLTKG